MERVDPTHDPFEHCPYRDSRGQPMADPRALHGIELRYLLTDLVASAPGRGRYRAGAVPGTTRRRIRTAARHRRTLLAALPAGSELAGPGGDRFT